jgi:hypothetical protein
LKLPRFKNRNAKPIRGINNSQNPLGDRLGREKGDIERPRRKTPKKLSQITVQENRAKSLKMNTTIRTNPSIDIFRNHKSSYICSWRKSIPSNFPKKMFQLGLKFEAPKSLPEDRKKGRGSGSRNQRDFPSRLDKKKKKIPEWEGIQDHLSSELIQGMWIWRIF